MKFTAKKIIIILLFFLTFSLAYVRESIFLIINTVIHDYPFPFNASYIKPPDFLYQWQIKDLITLKWGLTFGFSILFMGLSVLIINYFFKSKRNNIIVVLVYSFLLIISFIIIMMGYVLNKFDSFYGLSRFIMGLLQSPILPIFLFIVFYINAYHTQKE